MIKKILSILVPLCIILTGCKSNTENIKNDAMNKKSIEYIGYLGKYSYYNNGVAYTIGDSKVFLDFDTMERAPLCASPNCTHSTSDCLSKNIYEYYKPIFYNDYVYYFASNFGAVRETADGNEFYIESKLMKASLNSSSTETVCEFNDCVPRETGKYVLYGNELFFIGDNRGASADEYGNYDWGNTGGDFYLCSINLDTNEYINYGSVYEDDKQYDGAKNSRSSNINGIYNGTIYIAHAFVKDQSVDRLSDEYWTYVNFEFDLETKTWKESDLPYARFMNEDCYIYYDLNDKNVKVIYQEKEYSFDLGFNQMTFSSSNASELNGKLFFPSIGKWFDLSDSSEHSMGKYAEYDAVAYYDESYILINGGQQVKLSEEELYSLK